MAEGTAEAKALEGAGEGKRLKVIGDGEASKIAAIGEASAGGAECHVEEVGCCAGNKGVGELFHFGG